MKRFPQIWHWSPPNTSKIIEFECGKKSNVFRSLKDGQVNRCQCASGTTSLWGTERNTFGFHLYLSSWRAFSITRGAHLKTVIPYMRGHSCACPSAKWTGMCRLSRPWRTGLWARSPSPPLPAPSSPRTPWPEPTPPSWAVTRCAAGLCRMNRHSHISPGSVCSSVCVCVCVCVCLCVRACFW